MKSASPRGSIISLFIVICLLLLIGIVMVFDASVVSSVNTFGGKYHFLLLQASWVFVGIMGMLLSMKLDPSFLKKISFFLLFFSIICLVLVLLPTVFSPEIYGARRWLFLNPAPLPLLPFIGRLGFQPSELSKLSLVLYSAFWLPGKEKLSEILTYLGLVFLICGLVVIQPDFGTSLVIASIGLGMFFILKEDLRVFLSILPIVVLIALGFILISPYRRARLETYLRPDAANELTTGYHVNQIMIAVGSGGFFGLGPGESRQKYSYLPEVTTDSIFAILCEEFGFVGGLFVILLFIFIIYKLLRGIETGEKFSDKAIITGAALWISAQTILNLSAMAGVVPLTGVPLPLISYGGSSLVLTMFGLGAALRALASPGREKYVGRKS